MTARLSYMFLAFFHCLSSSADRYPYPADLEIIKLCGRIPARRMVEKEIIQQELDMDSVCSLYDNTVLSHSPDERYKMILVGETDQFTIIINKDTKELTRVFVND